MANRAFPFTDEHWKRYAEVMVWALEEARKNSGKGAVFSPGDKVILVYGRLASKMAEHVYGLLLQKGFHVILRPVPHEEMDRIFYTQAQEEQIKFIQAGARAFNKSLNGYIYLNAPESLTHLKGCDPAKLAMAAQTRKKLRKIWNVREFDGLFAWTLCGVPTPALARQARMSYADYARQIIKACYLNVKDPVAKWKKTMAQIDKVKEWLNGLDIEYVHVESHDWQTDLKIWLGKQRRWLGADGMNIPSFEIFTSPEAGHAEGVYCVTEPSFNQGRYVEGVRLVFKNGEVVEATAKKEEEFLLSRINLDRQAGMIGEFSLTDNRFSNITKFMASTLYDENVGGKNGNCHIAIGSSYPDTYAGKQKMTPALAKKLKFSSSAHHWDLVNTASKKVTAHLKNGKEVVIYKDGRFCLKI